MPHPDKQAIEEYCLGCVYHPPNLPRQAYPEADWAMLQARSCAFEYAAGSADCLATRKTSCSLVDLAATRHTIAVRHD